ncbi:hypothetical protein VM1G_11888 [Cytospora mali]|uniref:Uncharacterized protein n=1 Tax=Cytospora mali TaxID=578113 RepID=A0A194WB15_CYTMA|nr:hypothetical protein VM1G_11888 [Valsa mali]
MPIAYVCMGHFRIGRDRSGPMPSRKVTSRQRKVFESPANAQKGNEPPTQVFWLPLSSSLQGTSTTCSVVHVLARHAKHGQLYKFNY